MVENLPLERQWKLLQILGARRHGATVRELAEEFKVSEKTIRRDLQLLAKTGFPLVESVGDYGRKSWRVENGSGIPTLKFNLTEVLSLYLARQFLEPMAGTNPWRGAQSAFRKIRSTLSDSAIDYLDKLARVFQQTPVAAGDYSRQSELIERLLIATEDRKITWIVYQSANSTEPVSTEVYPLTLLWHRGSLYLLAHAREDDKIKTYKIDRITDVDVTQLTFNRPDDFDPQQFLSSSFGIISGDGSVTRVQVRFSSSVARYVSERKWHSSQQLTRQRDGSLLAEFFLSDLREFKAWLLSFGQQAEALSPASFRDDVLQTVISMQRVYESASSANPSSHQRGVPR